MGDNLYIKLQRVRAELLKEEINMTGENKYSNFKYYQMQDFLPFVTRISSEQGICPVYNIVDNCACLKIINCENIEESIEFKINLESLKDLQIKGANSVQVIGGLITYTKRYLYMMAFEIAEQDSFDNTMPNEQNKADDIKITYINDIKLKVIRKKLQEADVTEEKICETFAVDTLEHITEELFPRLMKKLDKTIEIKQNSENDLA